jgi:hypothetical protein
MGIAQERFYRVFFCGQVTTGAASLHRPHSLLFYTAFSFPLAVNGLLLSLPPFRLN